VAHPSRVRQGRNKRRRRRSHRLRPRLSAVQALFVLGVWRRSANIVCDTNESFPITTRPLIFPGGCERWFRSVGGCERWRLGDSTTLANM
jgi:hypothetical protein